MVEGQGRECCGKFTRGFKFKLWEGSIDGELIKIGKFWDLKTWAEKQGASPPHWTSSAPGGVATQEGPLGFNYEGKKLIFFSKTWSSQGEFLPLQSISCCKCALLSIMCSSARFPPNLHCLFLPVHGCNSKKHPRKCFKSLNGRVVHFGNNVIAREPMKIKSQVNSIY